MTYLHAICPRIDPMPELQMPPLPPFEFILTQEDIDRAKASGGKIVRVPTYQKNGEKTSHMLQRLGAGLREAWERKHGYGMVHVSYLENASFSPFTIKP